MVPCISIFYNLANSFNRFFKKENLFFTPHRTLSSFPAKIVSGHFISFRALITSVTCQISIGTIYLQSFR